jgi:hypothetical protein
MSMTAIKDKHLKLDQRKIDRVKKILGLKTETETIEAAMEMVIQKEKAESKRKEVVDRILTRRQKLKIKGDAAELVRIGREERDKALWNAIK